MSRGMSMRNWFEPIIEPCSRFSDSRSMALISRRWSSGTMPMMVAVPPTSSILNACSAVAFLPMASKL